MIKNVIKNNINDIETDFTVIFLVIKIKMQQAIINFIKFALSPINNAVITATNKIT